MDSYSATLSCAAIFVCTREEINENCVPRVCYSAHEEDVRRLLALHAKFTVERMGMDHGVVLSLAIGLILSFYI